MAKAKNSKNKKSVTVQNDTNEQYRSNGGVLQYYYYGTRKTSKPVCSDSLLDSIRKRKLFQSK